MPQRRFMEEDYDYDLVHCSLKLCISLRFITITFHNFKVAYQSTHVYMNLFLSKLHASDLAGRLGNS